MEKDLEDMTEDELVRALRGARVTGDRETQDAVEDELDRREWAREAREWAEGED